MMTSSRGRGLVGELDVRAAGRHADGARAGEGRLAEPLVLRVGQRLLRRDRPRVAGVDAHRVEVLDRADDDAVAGPIDHHLELELLPALDRPLDEGLLDRARLEAVREARPQLLLGSRKAAALAAERERRPDDRRRRGRPGARRASERRRSPARGRPAATHRVAERAPVLRPPDRVEVGADQLDPEAVEHAVLGELDRQVERRLARRASAGARRAAPSR